MSFIVVPVCDKGFLLSKGAECLLLWFLSLRMAFLPRSAGCVCLLFSVQMMLEVAVCV